MSADDMAAIEDLTREYSEARSKLGVATFQLQKELTVLKSRRLPQIRKLVAQVARCRQELAETLEESPGLFLKPKTRLFHSIRVGFEKSPGRVSWKDESFVVRMIRKRFPKQAKTLLKETTKPVKKALQRLSAEDLKRIGVTVEDTSDRVVIRAADSEIDKLIDALLAEDSESRDAV